MENHNKLVIGIGLPRTGTTSLAQALVILKYSGKHECIIFGSIDKDNELNEKKYLINNRFYSSLEEDLSKFVGAKFILTNRDDSEWKNSISYFNIEQKIITPSNYCEQVCKAFDEKNIRKDLLVINIFENNSAENWNQIASFLNETIPEEPFPCIKRMK